MSDSDPNMDSGDFEDEMPVDVKTEIDEEMENLSEADDELNSNNNDAETGKPHKCSDCVASFSRRSDLTRHSRLHDEFKPYKCRCCGKGFAVKSLYKYHLQKHAGELPFKCEECGDAFSRKHVLENHARVHTGEKPYKCNICGRTFSQKGTLHQHTRLHTGDKPYKCQMCKSAFIKPSYLRMHKCKFYTELPMELPESLHRCGECGAEFMRKRELLRHSRIHVKEATPEVCEFCGATFKNQTSLQTHKLRHTLDQQRALLELQAKVTAEAKADAAPARPVRKSHPGEDKVNAPPVKKPSKYRGVKVTGLRPFKCTECGAGFSEKHVLANHARVHTGEKPFKCDICDRMFSQKGTLHQHIRLHTGDKPHKCDMCGAAFIKPSYLKIHRRVHLGENPRVGENPYKCGVCDVSFARRSDFTRHVHVHNGVNDNNSADGGLGHSDVVNDSLVDSEVDNSAVNSSELVNDIIDSIIERAVDGSGGMDPAVGEFFRNTLAKMNAQSVFPGADCTKKRKIHNCPKCSAEFTRRSDLRRHARTHVGNAENSAAEFCDSTTRQNNEIHIPPSDVEPKPKKIVNCDEKPHKCGKCGVGFARKSDLRRHCRGVHGNVNYAINNENLSIAAFCEATFRQSSSSDAACNNETVQTVAEIPKPGDTFKCVICKAEFAQMEDLQTHELTHADDPLPLVSNAIGPVVTRHIAVRPRRVKNHVLQSFKCEECGAAFTQWSDLQRHKLTHTDDTEQSPADIDDGVATTQVVKVRTYRPQEPTERPFVCQECGAAFTRKHVLENHARVHSGEKPFKCAVCGIRFSQRGTLHQHVRLHTGDKPHKCNICGSAFIKPSYLKSHIAVHAGQRPYNCERCKLAFQKKSDLQKHHCLEGVE